MRDLPTEIRDATTCPRKQRGFPAAAALLLSLLVVSVQLVHAQTTPEGFIPGNAVELTPDSPNSFRNFAPVLESTLERTPPIDPDTGLHVAEIAPNLFFVTEGIYQSAFLVTNAGVVVFDAPPSYAHGLPAVIAQHAPGAPITHLVYSHGHTDHVGGASVFGDIDDLEVVAPSSVAEELVARGNPAILQPTLRYDDAFTLMVGGETIELTTASFHAENHDVIIYLSAHGFVMAIDTLVPSEVPFMDFGATADLGQYMAFYDDILSYDFEHILTGHNGILGTRADVIESREYVTHVRDAVLTRMPSLLERYAAIFADPLEFRNGNLAYRTALESIRRECSAELIDAWRDRLTAVDVFADSHCQKTILYFITH